MKAMKGYSAEIEVQMQRYYQSLLEKDRRRYAAIEAIKLEYGGAAYIRRLLGCHHETLQQGIRDLEDASIVDEDRIRQSGGGRNQLWQKLKELMLPFYGFWQTIPLAHPWMSRSSGPIHNRTA